MVEYFSKDICEAKPARFGSARCVDHLEVIMPERNALRGDILELLFSTAGVFPCAALEALIARLEVGR